MKRTKKALIFLALFGVVLATVAAVPPAVERSQACADQRLGCGGKDIGRGYGHGGKELGKGTAGFATGVAKADFGDAGKSMGSGAAEFGQGVGRGSARGFKHIGLACRDLGRKIDRSVSGE